MGSNRRLTVGLLPGFAGGICVLQAAGQEQRLIEGYLKPYARRFERVYYFSYYDEGLEEYTDDPELLSRVQLLPRPAGLSHKAYALRLPLLYRRALRDCAVLRVFQITGTPPAVLARWLYGTPYVATYGYCYAEFARLEGNHRLARWYRAIEAVGLRSASGVIVTTPELRTYVGSRVASDRVHLIPNGVDTGRFVPAPRSEPDRAVPELIFVGRLEPQKNLGRLLEAMAQLSTRRPVRVTLIGDGSLRADLERQAAALGVQATFLGVVPQAEVLAHLQRAAAFVLPSLIEGHPKALIEAMSCGLPCVVSDCDGNRHLVEDDVTGLLFAPEDVGTMARQIERVLEDQDLAAQLGAAAREQAVEHYELSGLVEREIALLENVARG